MNKVFLAVSTIALASFARAAAPAEPTVTAADLPRVKPTEPADVMKTFKVRPGFRLELAAAEPLVVDPIAMSFDEDGRMYVVEMRDYSEHREDRLSRVRLLEDTDGDGKYDKSVVFLDNLPWATAVTCTRGGVLVGACPDVIFAKDTDGDGVADEKRVVFTGFGPTKERLNVQGLFNNFLWGLDNRIHGCSGLVGGMVRVLAKPDRPPIDIRGKGIVVDPRDWTMTTEHGGGQYGLSFDPWGRLFTCMNSSHCEAFVYDSKYAARNPHVAMPDPRVSIAVDGPAAEVFRASPEEPYRVIRTRWRIAGLVSGPVEGGGRSAGYFTGATGVTVYKGDAFGPGYVGHAFTGDAGGNLVHHKRVREEGVTLVAERPEDERDIEFIASTDNWFRPVDFANAPDGTLYIADMYRETIEHPWSIPPQIKQFLDLNSGNDRGRIYRVAPDGFKQRPAPKLGRATTAELVPLLAHANAWHRETASRLIFERQDKAAAPLLKDLAAKSESPFGRMHAFYALDGLDALTPEIIAGALKDEDAHVREHAVKLAEAFPALQPAVAGLAEDPSARVRMQVAFSTADPAALTAIAKRDAETSWTRAAILSSSSEIAPALFGQLWNVDSFRSTPGGQALLSDLARVVGARQRPDDLAKTIALLGSSPDPRTSLAVARGLLDGARGAGQDKLAPLFARAATLVADTGQAAETRTAAAALLGYAPFDRARDPLLSLIGTRQPTPIAAAALASLDRFDDPAVASEILARWPEFRPREANDALAILTKRPARALALLNAVKDGRLPADAIGAQQVSFLHAHSNREVQSLAKQLLTSPAAQREAVVGQFRSAAALPGDRGKGKALFEQRCASCHRADGAGFAVGPDMVTVRNSGKDKLLLSILDPSREVSPNYVAFTVETKDGESLVGVIANDTPTSITVRQPYGNDVTLQRDRIKRMSSQGKSLMPDGLEVGLTPESFADLLQFVATAEK
jgi:putative membrane-bound dehydrogenase-like protein